MYDDDFNYDDEKQQCGLSLFYETNKKLVWLLLGIIIFIIILLIIVKVNNNGNQKQDLPIEVAIMKKSDFVSVGNTMTIYANVKNVTNAKVEWSSSDTTIATVDQNGLIKGINYGTVNIIAKYTHNDGSTYLGNCEIIVSEGDPDVKIKNVSLPDGEILMNVGQVFSLPVMIEPTDGYKKNVIYTSNDKSVATIDQNGDIKALKVGMTLVEINVNNGEFTDSIVVNVIRESVNSQVMIIPKTISFMESEKTLVVGDTYQLQYNVYPENSTSLSYEWTNSNGTVASVNNGFIRALKSGKTEIMLKSKYSNVYSKLTLTVVEREVLPQAIMISSQSVLNLKVGDTSQIIASVIPDNATDCNINYTSNNTNIATVDNRGLITAIGEGQTIITLSTSNGKNVLISVNVTKNSSDPVTGYSLEITSNTKTVNKTYENVMRDVALAREKVVVNVAYSGTIDKISICTKYDYQEGDISCNPQSSSSIMINSSGEKFTIDKSGVTQFGYVAYDRSGNIVTKGERFVRIQYEDDKCYLNTVNGRYVWGDYTSNNFVYKSQYKTKDTCLNNNG